MIHDSSLIAGRHLHDFRMSPGRLIYPLVQPVVLLFLFTSVMGNLIVAGHGFQELYRQFLIPGILIQNAALTAPVTGLALRRDADSGLADRFRSLPMSRSAVLIGRVVSDSLVFAVQASLLLAVASLLGFQVHSGPFGWLAIVATSVTFGVSLAVTCSWLGLLIHDAETAERVLFFPAIAISFLSSAFAPVGQIAGWLQPIANASPVTAAVDVVRSIASGSLTPESVARLACWLLVLTILPGLLAIHRWQAAN